MVRQKDKDNLELKYKVTEKLVIWNKIVDLFDLDTNKMIVPLKVQYIKIWLLTSQN